VGGVCWSRISTLPRQPGQEGEEVASVAIAAGKEGPAESDESELMRSKDDIELSIVRTDG